MKLYHDTNMAFDAIDIQKSKPNMIDEKEMMKDDRTTLYYQSPRYVFDFLRNELTLGKVI